MNNQIVDIQSSKYNINSWRYEFVIHNIELKNTLKSTKNNWHIAARWDTQYRSPTLKMTHETIELTLRYDHGSAKNNILIAPRVDRHLMPSTRNKFSLYITLNLISTHLSDPYHANWQRAKCTKANQNSKPIIPVHFTLMWAASNDDRARATCPEQFWLKLKNKRMHPFYYVLEHRSN